MQNRGSGAKKGLPLWAFILIAGGCIFFLVVAVLFLQVGDLGNSLLSTTSTISNWSSASAVTSSIDAGETNAHYLRIGETPQDTHKTTKEDEVLNEIELQQYKNSWIVTSQQGVKVYSSPNEVASVVDLLPLATIIAGDVLTRESEHDKVTTTWLLCSYPIEGWVIVSRCLSGSESEHLVRPLDTSHAFEYLARPPAAGGVSFCANTSNYLPQTDYHGGDLTVAQSPGLRNPVHVGSLAECCTACGNTLNCAYWTHTAEGDCWLKSSVATKVSVGPQKKLISGAAPVLVGRVALGVNAAFSASNGPEITTSTHCCGFSPALSSVGRAFNLHQWSANMPLYYLNGSSSSVSSSGGEGADGKAPLTGDENMVISPPIPVREIQTALDSTFITHTSRSQDSSSDVTSKAAGAAEPGANPADAGDGVNVRLITPFTTTTAAAAAATMTLLQRERFTADWTEQQAIGNGKFGALVGGNMRAEIIPVSIAGLYVKKAVNVNAGKIAMKMHCMYVSGDPAFTASFNFTLIFCVFSTKTLRCCRSEGTHHRQGIQRGEGGFQAAPLHRGR